MVKFKKTLIVGLPYKLFTFGKVSAVVHRAQDHEEVHQPLTVQHLVTALDVHVRHIALGDMWVNEQRWGGKGRGR